MKCEKSYNVYKDKNTVDKEKVQDQRSLGTCHTNTASFLLSDYYGPDANNFFWPDMVYQAKSEDENLRSTKAFYEADSVCDIIENLNGKTIYTDYSNDIRHINQLMRLESSLQKILGPNYSQESYNCLFDKAVSIYYDKRAFFNKLINNEVFRVCYSSNPEGEFQKFKILFSSYFLDLTVNDPWYLNNLFVVPEDYHFNAAYLNIPEIKELPDDYKKYHTQLSTDMTTGILSYLKNYVENKCQINSEKKWEEFVKQFNSTIPDFLSQNLLTSCNLGTQRCSYESFQEIFALLNQVQLTPSNDPIEKYLEWIRSNEPMEKLPVSNISCSGVFDLEAKTRQNFSTEGIVSEMRKPVALLINSSFFHNNPFDDDQQKAIEEVKQYYIDTPEDERDEDKLSLYDLETFGEYHEKGYHYITIIGDGTECESQSSEFPNNNKECILVQNSWGEEYYKKGVYPAHMIPFSSTVNSQGITKYDYSKFWICDDHKLGQSFKGYAYINDNPEFTEKSGKKMSDSDLRKKLGITKDEVR